MPLVNEKFLRLLLVLVGIASLGAFGWRIYDYWKKKDSLLQPVNVTALQEQAGGGPRADPGHLLPFERYEVIERLNVTAKEPERPVEAAPPPPPVAKLLPTDLLVTYIQFIEADHPLNAAYIQPTDEQPDPAGLDTPGDLYVAGDRIPIRSKKDLPVRLRRVEAEQVVVEYGEGDTAGELTLGISAFELPESHLRHMVPGAGADVPDETARTVPPETRLNEAGDYEVGSEDAAYFEKLTQEEVLAAVPLKPERDRLSNQIRGLRIQSVPENSPFSRLGLRADDVVLEVNGMPAVNRDDLLQAMRNSKARAIEVKVERLGAVRTIRYLLP